MKGGPRTTNVNIYGHIYTLRSEHDPAELQRLARRVDETMRSIAPDPASADGLKVAVLAAMNLADEAERRKLSIEEREERIESVSSRLSALLEPDDEKVETIERTRGRSLDGPAPSP